MTSCLSKPNASEDEKDSPFYLANEKICLEFEAFIHSKGGKTGGKYNAWSYHAVGKIDHPNQWEFRIKKSTYSNGSVLLSSEYQNLLVAAT